MFTLASKDELTLLSAPQLELNSLFKVKGKKCEPHKEKKSNFQCTEYSKCSLEIPILFTTL